MSKSTSPPSTNDIYEPHEDSFLLATVVKKYARGIVLDMGTGSGILAETAAQKRSVTRVIAADVNPTAVAVCKQKKHKKIECVQSDLFSALQDRQFDSILFNPPYLPQEYASCDVALEGGKHGYELTERFLNEAGDHLREKGQIFLLFSSRGQPEHVEKALKQNLFDAGVVASKELFFEELIVYRIRKSTVRERVERCGVTTLRYLAKGHRSIVFSGKYRDRTVAVKVFTPRPDGRDRARHEATVLKKLNKHSIGPHLLACGNGFLVEEFVQGAVLRDWLPEATTSDLQMLVDRILDQCFALDTFSINKLELHRPYKHIFIHHGTITMIDFERWYKTKKPKNVSQFCQFLHNNAQLFHKRGLPFSTDDLLRKVKKYKQKPSQTTLQELKTLFT